MSNSGRFWRNGKKKCPKCGKRKPETEYYKSKSSVNGSNTEGFIGWCKTCHNHKGLLYRRGVKRLVFSWYGGKCICCQERWIDFLTLDHVNDDGYKDNILDHRGIRRRLGGWTEYLRIKNLGYENRPKDRQVLCFNCQWGKVINKGFCSHHPRIDLRIRKELHEYETN
jgi:hypothetical protein